MSSVKLHARLTEFREDLQKKVDSMKNPQAYHTNKDLPRFVTRVFQMVNSKQFCVGIKMMILFSDFYTKWLKGIDSDWLIRNAEGGSRLNAGTRSSVMNMSRRSSRLAMVRSFVSHMI